MLPNLWSLLKRRPVLALQDLHAVSFARDFKKTCVPAGPMTAAQTASSITRLHSVSAHFRSAAAPTTNTASSSVQDTLDVMPGAKHRVTVVGSGNWGSAIAKIVAENTKANPDLFEEDVQMWVYEEELTLPKSSKHYSASSELASKPQKLTHLINELHENVKYLPGITLPSNIKANPSIVDAVKGATVLVFNLPHQFIARVCQDIVGKIVPYARGVSCIKGVDVSPNGINLFSESISSKLGIYCGALSGANIANEVALEKFSETTIAYDMPMVDAGDEIAGEDQKTKKNTTGGEIKLTPVPKEYQPLTHYTIQRLFHRPYFHVRMTSDVAGVSLGGALKNVVALAAGFVDGLGWGDNAKAAVMRVGILEQVKFGRMFFPDSFESKTMLQESCGVADMITSCSGGRNFRCAKMSVAEKKSIAEIEDRELNGQKLQGTSTADEVYTFLKQQGKEKEFPLFIAVRDVLHGNVKAEQIPDLIESKS